jgi:hypothetical protein
MKKIILNCMKLTLLIVSLMSFFKNEYDLATYMAVLILVVTDAYPTSLHE